jgi:hypothetical protein
LHDRRGTIGRIAGQRSFFKREKNMDVRHVVIVATSHRYQVSPSGPAADEFRAFLDKVCNAHQVQAIAEELTRESCSPTSCG